MTALPLLGGCIVNSRSETTQTGNYVSESQLARVTPGTLPSTVQAMLGEPDTKDSMDDGTEVWRWAYREETTKEGSAVRSGASHASVATTRESRSWPSASSRRTVPSVS